MEAPFIHPKMLEKWSEMTVESNYRKTYTRLFKPPFVVVNRTSSPGDIHRAPATLIKGKKSVAVENHLIVLTPRKGGMRSCRKLVKLLRSSTTDNYLNERIRCRHLTVGSVKDIPWSD